MLFFFFFPLILKLAVNKTIGTSFTPFCFSLMRDCLTPLLSWWFVYVVIILILILLNGSGKASSPGECLILAEFGGMQLEFKALSHFSKNPIYAQKV